MNGVLRFIIIGEVPGTDIQLSFKDSILLSICLVCTIYLVVLRFSKRKSIKISTHLKNELVSKTI